MLSLPVKRVIQKIRNKESTVQAVNDVCVKRIRKLQHLNVFITPTVDEQYHQNVAQAQKKYDKGLPCGSFEGIPIAVKDNFSTEGIKTTCGSRTLAGYVPPYTATVVRKLQDNGALMVGKTTMDEFAMGCGTVDGYCGPCKNPWLYPYDNSNKESPAMPPTGTREMEFYVAGGSSGGSAVAVATGMAFCALGSDTGGSTRNPASYCGVVGLKPTYGLLSRHGLIPLVNSLDVPGIFARKVDDAAYMMNVLSGHDPLDSTTVEEKHAPVELPQEVSLKGLHVGIPKEYHGPGLASDVLRAWQRVADAMEDAGARVSQVSLPHTQYSIVTYSVLSACEIASNMARYDGIQYGHRAGDESSTENLYATTRHEGFNDVVRGRILAGNFFLLKKNYDQYFLQAQRVRRLIANDFREMFQTGVDLVLTPTVLSDAPPYEEFSQADNRTRTQEQDIFTQPTNLAGIPAVTVPCTLSDKGLPIGLQLIADHFQEQKLLTAAKWMEQYSNFPHLNLDWLDDT